MGCNCLSMPLIPASGTTFTYHCWNQCRYCKFNHILWINFCSAILYGIIQSLPTSMAHCCMASTSKASRISFIMKVMHLCTALAICNYKPSSNKRILTSYLWFSSFVFYIYTHIYIYIIHVFIICRLMCGSAWLRFENLNINYEV